MGGCCPGGTYSEVEEPSPATKRRQLAEAAEKRQADNINRGVKVNVMANVGPGQVVSLVVRLINRLSNRTSFISSHFL